MDNLGRDMQRAMWLLLCCALIGGATIASVVIALLHRVRQMVHAGGA